jgi:hypothetical protein
MKLVRFSAATLIALSLTATAPALAKTEKSESATAQSAQASDTRSAAAGQSSPSRFDDRPVARDRDWSWLGLLGLLGLAGLFRRRDHHEHRVQTTDNDRVRVYTK